MVQAYKQRRVSPQEYLAQEVRAFFKSEYYAGEIIPMAGASINHNRIVRNLVRKLGNLLDDAGYEVFASDMRLWIPESQTYTYPDVLVIKGEPYFQAKRNDTVTNPVMLVEVLSALTRGYDRGDKMGQQVSIAALPAITLTVHAIPGDEQA